MKRQILVTATTPVSTRHMTNKKTESNNPTVLSTVGLVKNPFNRRKGKIANIT